MYQVINQAIAGALGGKELIPQVEIGGREEKQAEEKETEHRAPEPFETKRMAAMGIAEKRADYPVGPKKVRPEEPPAAAAPKTPVPSYTQSANRPPVRNAVPEAADQNGADEPKQLEMFDNRLLSEKSRYRHRLIGQVFDTYWLVEFNDNLYIIDQHAAHEKVLFEKNFASLKSREYTSQFISPPIILTLSMQEEELLKRHMDVFTDIGFEIEHFGGNEYAVRAVPDNLFSLAKKELLLELLDGLTEDNTGNNSEAIYNRIATMSCKAAVKGNNRLSEREANELIDQLLGLENPYACPHGRPTIVSISKYEMEKKFKRIL